MEIHHIGYAVKNIEDAAKKFELLGYESIEENKKADLDRNINVLLMKNGEYLIELIEIKDTNKESPIDYIVKNSKNQCTPYHICYYSKDLTKTIKELRKDKFLIVKEKAYSKVFNKYVAFLYNRDIGFIELIEE